MKNSDLHWLAGLLEGEGCFGHPAPSKPNQPYIQVEMTDKDVIDRVGDLLGATVFLRKSRYEGQKPTYHLRIRGRKAINMMEKLRPLMGERRGQKIDDITSEYKVL